MSYPVEFKSTSESTNELVPVTWEQLGPNWIFMREPATQAAYDISRTKLKKEGKSIEQDLFEKYPQLKTSIVLVENAFPYYLSSNISHLLAWLPVQIDPRTDVAEYLRPLLAKALNPLSQNESIPMDFKMFENFPANRSVKGIRHFHVFTRRKST